MPKLLQINECLNFSTGKIAQSIGEKAIAYGWESWIAYSSRESSVPCKSNVIKVGTKLNSYFHYLENRIFDREGLSSRLATKRLITEIKKIDPDVVHLHNIHDHWLNYRLLFEYLNSTDIEVVWTFHDCWAFTGHCFHFVTKDCERWKTECYDCPLVHEYPNTLIDRSKKNFLLKKQLFCDSKKMTIVPCSDWMRDFVKQSFLKDKNIRVIKNGVDLDIFRPSSAKSSEYGKFRILGISNVWNREKGLYDFYQLREMLCVDEYEVVLVGLTQEQIKALPYGIRGIHRTQNVQELVDIYSSSDVLINPTYADTFPTINLESLACGTPIITYETGGSPEAVDEKTGVVISQGDVSALVQAIRSIKKKQLSSLDCRIRAEMLFDKDKCFEKYINLYEELVRK